MSELMSALSIALETSLPERIDRGETTVDHFLEDEGFNADELSIEIDRLVSANVVSANNGWTTLLSQKCNDLQTVFRDQEILNGLVEFLRTQAKDQTVVMSAGGIGSSVRGRNLHALRGIVSTSNRNLDESRLERADSLANANQRADLKGTLETPSMETRGAGSRKGDNNHRQEFRDYWRLYSAGRKELGNITLKTIEVDIVKRIIRHKEEVYAQHYIDYKNSSKRNDWATASKNYSGNIFSASANYGHKKKYTRGIFFYDYYPKSKGGQDETVDLGNLGTMDIDNRADGYELTIQRKDKKWTTDTTIYTSGTSVVVTSQLYKKNKLKQSEQVTISFGEIWRHTKAYQREQALVKAHQQGDLIPEKVKARFGAILALSSIAYNMKKRIAIEKQYWPKAYSMITDTTRESGWGKAYQEDKSRSILSIRLVWSKNQKRDAKEIRMLYGVQVAANQSVKDATINAHRVYKRSISDGLSVKNAERIADLTYVSDIALFDSFIASSDLSRIASGRISHLAYYSQDLSEMTYAGMPFVIRRQIHDSQHLYNLERIEPRHQKLASELLTYDLFKNKCLTEVLQYGDKQYAQYLGFDPVHRIFRDAKNDIKSATDFLDKWVFDPLIGGAVRLFTFNQWHGTILQKAFNGTLGFGESLVFGFLHGIKTLPKHLYTDTKKLSHQLGRVLTGQATWKGTWDALGRDTKAPRRLLKFGFNNSLGGWLWHQANHTSDPILQHWSNLFSTVGVGISAARHKAEIKKDMSLATFEMNLHKSLGAWSPDLFQSSIQLAKSNYPKAFMHLHSIEINAMTSLLTYINNNLNTKQIAKLELDVATNTMPSLTSAQKTKINNKIKNFNLKGRVNHYLFSNSSTLKKQFEDIHERQANRFQRQLKIYRFTRTHRQELGQGLLRATTVIKEQRYIKTSLDLMKQNINSQIQTDWTSGGAKLFRHIFVDPILFQIPVPNKQSAAVHEELNDISKFGSTHKFGQKVFADILLGNLVSRLVHNKSITTYAKSAASKLDSSMYGKSAIDLIRWDTRSFRSRMGFVFSIARISVNETGIESVTSAVKLRTLSLVQSSKFKAYAQQHAWASDDFQWYSNTKAKGHFLKQWKKRINVDAGKTNSNGVAAAWQKDVKQIKQGKTLTVGQIIDSLKPNGDDWRLTLARPSKPQPDAPNSGSGGTNYSGSTTNPDQEKNGSKQTPDDQVTVNLLGFRGHYEMAKRLVNGSPKNDPAKDKGKTLEKEADTKIDNEAQELETSLEQDIDSDVVDAVDEIVETDVVDAESLMADAEIDVLA